MFILVDFLALWLVLDFKIYSLLILLEEVPILPLFFRLFPHIHLACNLLLYSLTIRFHWYFKVIWPFFEILKIFVGITFFLFSEAPPIFPNDLFEFFFFTLLGNSSTLKESSSSCRKVFLLLRFYVKDYSSSMMSPDSSSIARYSTLIG